jgi:hypothetical protein
MKKAREKLYLVILVLPSIIRLLKYSFEPIKFNYDNLTPKEKECISREDFDKVKLLCND